MIVGIMQPYFLPYVGYFQLLNYCDTFLIYDDIEYTKKGWINRNRFQQNGEIRNFSLNLKSASDYLQIKERELSDDFDRLKMSRAIEAAYRKAPHFEELIKFLQPIITFESNNLFLYLENSIRMACQYLGITSKIIKTSELEIGADLRGQERVLRLCELLDAKQYVNPIGGLDLYDRASFKDRGIELKFIKSRLSPYPQGNFEFVSALSIVDQIAFCGSTKLRLTLEKDFDIR